LLNRAHEEHKLTRKEYNSKLKQLRLELNMKNMNRNLRNTMIVNEMIHEIDKLIPDNETIQNKSDIDSLNEIQIIRESRGRRINDINKRDDVSIDIQI
jgi:hypothetical protein